MKPAQRLKENGTILRAEIPVSESSTGKLHYKALISTLSGSEAIYPADGSYYELGIEYRAAYGRPIWLIVPLRHHRWYRMGWSRSLFTVDAW